ncbi:hypothetical protein [Halobacteriovorax sp. ZH5_bin.2]|uniref:hypothetical protein n=1 Tax=Halobacteriovorax sp. ZH5_bin.2 TaxID=3157727 RepID=UPI003715425F
MIKTYSGINIQWPISEEIVTGNKTIETRTYPIPTKYLNEEMLLIETPGKKGDFQARITAIIKFNRCIQYKNKSHFYKDSQFHLVERGSPWEWKEKPKFGWVVELIHKFDKPIPFPKNLKKGILYTNNIKI